VPEAAATDVIKLAKQTN